VLPAAPGEGRLGGVDGAVAGVEHERAGLLRVAAPKRGGVVRNFRPERPLHVDGEAIVDAEGNRVVLRGVGLGGWMNMENFITGHPATESQMRAAVTSVLGPERAERFFDRLLTRFFEDGDARLLADLGVNCVRIPVNCRHFERDERPFELREEGFERLDRVVRLCAEQGIHSVIDLHVVPGCQNQHWHSDNPTHVAAFWQHPHSQDRVVHLWQGFATRYRHEPWIAGYNLLNEPADPSGAVVGPFHDRLVAAIREIDADHIVFVDGNTYSTDFSMFAEPYENARPSPDRPRPHARVAQPAARVADLRRLHRRPARGDPPQAHHRRGLALPRAHLRVGRRQRGLQRGRHAARHGLAAPARPRLHRQGVPLGPSGRSARQALLQRLQPRGDRPRATRRSRSSRTSAATGCRSTASASRAISGSSTPIPTRGAPT
jgi:hypothetical protein